MKCFIIQILKVPYVSLGMMLAMSWYYFKHVRPRLERKRKRAHRHRMIPKLQKQKEYMERLTDLEDVDCKKSLRMDKQCFKQFCFLLADTGGLKLSKYVTLEEKVATFLVILVHHTKNRVAMFAFRRSGH